MGSRPSRNSVRTGDRNVSDARQGRNRLTKFGETDAGKKNVGQDTESSRPSTSRKFSINLPGGSIMNLSESDDESLGRDAPLHQFHTSREPESKSNQPATINMEHVSGSGLTGGWGGISIRRRPEEFYRYPTSKSYERKPFLSETHKKEVKNSTVNDILKVKAMVEKLLPHVEEDKVSKISDSLCKIAGGAVLESDEHSRSIVFGYDKNRLSISVDTVAHLVDKRCLREVDLLLPENELPDLAGKSRKEILDILASSSSKDHENLIKCLMQRDIAHIVSPYTKHIFVSNFTGQTISKLGDVIRELQTDLSISGGGPCEYLMFSADPTEELPSPSSTQEYQRKIATSIQKSVRDRKIKIGVIDSGCSHLLYKQLTERETVVMHTKMISAVDASRAIETDYDDCFVDGVDTGHGTGVVEIIANCVLSGTEIFVASIGHPFSPSNVECAMMALFERSVNVLNCSFGVEKSRNLAHTLKILKSDGVIVVAAVGNGNSHDSIDTALNDGNTILVGSHNDQNSISTFSIAQCRANICSLGEGVYIASVQPNFRNGTSFATPNVTAAVANVLSFISTLAADLRRNLKLSAQDVRCGCNQHEGREVHLKFHPESFVNACFGGIVH